MLVLYLKTLHTMEESLIIFKVLEKDYLYSYFVCIYSIFSPRYCKPFDIDQVTKKKLK